MWMWQGSRGISPRTGRFRWAGALVTAAFLVTAALGLACGREQGAPGGAGKKAAGGAGGAPGLDPSVDKIVVARAGHTAITAGDLDLRMRTQFPDLKNLGGPETVMQKWELLLAAFDEALWVAAGERKGLEKDPEYRQQLEYSRQFILSRYAQNKLVQELAAPTEKAIRQYYDDNIDRFQQPARATVQIILVPTRGEADALRRRATAGEDFSDLARRYSKDERSAPSGGNLGQVGTNSLVAGFETRFLPLNEAIFATPAGQITPVVQSPRGFCFFRVAERAEAKTASLEEVRPSVVKWLTSNQANKAQAEILDETTRATKATIDTTAWYDYAFKVLTEEEAFQLAQAVRRPERSIAWYTAFAKRYPLSPRAPQALFLAGFSYAENMQDFQHAGVLFRQVVEKYPQSDLVASAKWMLENMDKGLQNLPYAGELKRRAYQG
jgi:peptidyl-prolyl cis-trans isomerase C